MEKIKYRYADSCGNGYMVFTTADDISYTFSYKEPANEPMSRAVSYIQEHSPNTKIEFIAQSAIKDESAPSAYMESYPKIAITITSGKQFLNVNTLFNIVTIKRMPDGFVTFGLELNISPLPKQVFLELKELKQRKKQKKRVSGIAESKHQVPERPTIKIVGIPYQEILRWNPMQL